MAAAKKNIKTKNPRTIPPTTLALDPLDKPIEGPANIGLAAGVIDHRGRPRTRVVRYRLENKLLPGFKKRRTWFTTLRMLMNDQAAEVM
jgi:hypothetical protein